MLCHMRNLELEVGESVIAPSGSIKRSCYHV